MKDILIGKEFISNGIVSNEKTAQSIGSGDLEVFSTPMMIALMENASYRAIEEYLDEGESSVGIFINVEHIAATPINENVYAKAVVENVEGKIITFNVEAFDDKKMIGKGKHKRAVINKERFLSKIFQ